MASKRQRDLSSSATVGYEAELWRMADALRGLMDAAEYKHIVLGLIFLISTSGTPRPELRTCWGVSTSISWDSLPVLRVARRGVLHPSLRG